jgi:hypothetical protein
MIKETLMFFKKNISIIILLIVFALFLDRYFQSKSLYRELDETNKALQMHYYNKFCTKYYDVSCDKIKIK